MRAKGLIFVFLSFIFSFLSPPLSLFATSSDSSGPLFISDRQGNVLVVWKSVDAANDIILLKGRFYKTETGWENPFLISDGINESIASSPRISIDSNGNAMFIWVSNLLATQRFAVRSRSIELVDGSFGNFETIQTISDIEGGENPVADLTLVVDSSNAFYVTWTTYLTGLDHSSLKTAKTDSYSSIWYNQSTMSDS